MRIKTIKIAPGQAFELTAPGDYVRVRSAAVDLTIENPDAGEILEVSQGDDFQMSPFKSLRISHASGAEQVVKLIVATGKKAGSSQVGGSISVAGQQGPYTQKRVSVTNVNQVVLFANAARRYLLIQNNDLSAVLRVRLDGSAATATAGFRVQPGGVLELPNYAASGAVNAMMETATAAANNVEIAEG